MAAAALSAATCQDRRANESAKPTPPAAAPSASAAPSPTKSGAGQEKAADPPPERPEPKWESLSATARRELQNVLDDEFCYCGCPHSIGACLKSHAPCKHAGRMADLAASEAETGAPSVEISNTLSRYYLSFREPRHTFRIDDRLCQGAKDAKITLVEFSDFECPYCGALRPTLEKFAVERAALVRLCYAPFPLPNHPHAQVAWQAALFARDHGKFWAMHDLLFENQTHLSPELIRELAGRIGLSASQLSEALDSSKYADELNAMRSTGTEAGVISTPTLYINGRKLTLSANEKNLKRSVEDELEWAAHNNGWAAD
jgi:predicted DsbA family dithiol-disulfide isomerase